MEGFDVIGFDIEQHVYGEHQYPAQLVIQNVLTLHGSQFRDAALIVASPPCQEFSYMAMPWTKAKAKAVAILADETGKMRADLTRLFDACFRIQREACEAAGHHVPLVVENVRGAQPWVGRAQAKYGSYYVWGDVPASMPNPKSFKPTGMNWSDRQAVEKMTTAELRRLTGDHDDGIKQGGSWFHDKKSISHMTSSKSPQRKRNSALIAKIPLALSRHIGRTYAA